MLRNLKELNGFQIHATDGDIGTVDDFFFEDDTWKIRYVIVDTGRWLPGRRVLLSPVAIGRPEWDERKLPVPLSVDRIKSSPDVNTDKPVSRQEEEALHEHYTWQPYWAPGIGGVTPEYPGMVGAPLTGEVLPSGPQPGEERPHGNPHLRSVGEVLGYDVEGLDGAVGHVEDFLFDEMEWAIQWMVVDTGVWLPGKRVLISPRWITNIDWSNATVKVDLFKEVIKASPPYDPEMSVGPQFEEMLYEHYRAT